jgi:hypothetical protein
VISAVLAGNSGMGGTLFACSLFAGGFLASGSLRLHILWFGVVLNAAIRAEQLRLNFHCEFPLHVAAPVCRRPIITPSLLIVAMKSSDEHIVRLWTMRLGKRTTITDERFCRVIIALKYRTPVHDTTATLVSAAIELFLAFLPKAAYVSRVCALALRFCFRWPSVTCGCAHVCSVCFKAHAELLSSVSARCPMVVVLFGAHIESHNSVSARFVAKL